MIDVIATIQIKPGSLPAFLKFFKDNVPAVLQEDGCIHYYPAVDIDSGLAIQAKDPDAVTVVERWESVAALQAHLRAPHMMEYREKVKDLVEGTSLKVLQPA